MGVFHQDIEVESLPQGASIFDSQGTIEVSSKKLDLNTYINRTKPTKNREQCHFIRIGILHHNSPRKIEEQMGQDGQ